MKNGQLYETIVLSLLISGVWNSRVLPDENVPLLNGRISENMRTELQRRDVSQIRFEGNQQFSDQQLRAALLSDIPVQGAARGVDITAAEWNGIGWEDFKKLAADQIVRAYHRSGFCHVDVKVEDRRDEGFTLKIQEGNVYRWGTVEIQGCNDALTKVLQQRLTTVSDSARRALPPGRSGALFEPDNVAELSTNRKRLIRQLVDDTLARHSYGFASATIQLLPDNEDELVRVRVKIDCGRQTQFCGLKVNGNERYTSEQIVELTGLPSSGPAAAEICDRAEQALYDSGRFLYADVSPGTPFDADQDVELNINVREYDGAAPNKELSESDTKLVNLTQALSGRSRNSEDLIVEGTFDGDKLSDRLRGGAVAWTSWLTEPLRVSGQWNFKVVCSRKHGGILRLWTTSENDAAVDCSIVMTTTHYGLINHRRKTSWLTSDIDSAFPGMLIDVSLKGLKESVNGNRSAFRLDVRPDFRHNLAAVRFNITPAALLRLVQLQTNESADSDKKASADSIHVASDEQISHVSFQLDGFRFQANTEAERLKVEEAGLLQAVSEWPKPDTPNQSLTSLIQFLATNYQRQCATQQMPIHAFAWGCLKNRDTAEQLARAWRMCFAAQEFRVPVPPDVRLPEVEFSRWRIVQNLFPGDSILSRILGAYASSAEYRTSDLIKCQFIEMVSLQHPGPICCLTAAAFTGDADIKITTALSALVFKQSNETSLLADLQMAMPKDGFLPAFIRSGIQQLRHMKDPELEELATALQQWNDASIKRPLFKSGIAAALKNLRTSESQQDPGDPEQLTKFIVAEETHQVLKSFAAKVLLNSRTFHKPDFEKFSLTTELEKEKSDKPSTKKEKRKMLLAPVSLELPDTGTSIFGGQKAKK